MCTCSRWLPTTRHTGAGAPQFGALFLPACGNAALASAPCWEAVNTGSICGLLCAAHFMEPSFDCACMWRLARQLPLRMCLHGLQRQGRGCVLSLYADSSCSPRLAHGFASASMVPRTCCLTRRRCNTLAARHHKQTCPRRTTRCRWHEVSHRPAPRPHTRHAWLERPAPQKPHAHTTRRLSYHSPARSAHINTTTACHRCIQRLIRRQAQCSTRAPSVAVDVMQCVFKRRHSL